MLTALSASLAPWLDEAVDRLAGVALASRIDRIGRIESVQDGIVVVSGLDDVRAGELLRFQGETDGSSDVAGYANLLDPDRVSCVLLDATTGLAPGQIVRGTGDVIRIPVGDSLLGRVLDPLGRPLDGLPPPEAVDYLPAERPAPPIIDRDLVTQPLQTGIVVIDSMFALGRGQRELIIGDRATGKTAIATDTVINQKRSDVISIYVAVGQKTSSIQAVIESIRLHGAPERTCFIIAGPAAAPGLQWLAPYAGMTIAEYFRDRGQHALLVIDDLSKHAATHRELTLLMGQPPGREAYPGDIFYTHARLLERAAKLADRLGGGSLSALPIAETEAGNLAGYIPTNLISITDGQIVVDSKLFSGGQRPAVDVGRSVSRVGGKSQANALKQLAEPLRLDYAQFLELELFSRFGAAPDARVAAQLEHGRRIRAVLQQGQYAPASLAEEVALLTALSGGALDPLPLDRVTAFRTGLEALLSGPLRSAAAEIDATGTLGKEDRERFAVAVMALAAASATARA